MLDAILNSFFYFIIIISFIVFIHELGHYLVAKWCGVKIEAFAIGFGKEIFGFNDKSGTRWKFCMIPLGGYVQMFGDSDPASSPDADKMQQMTEAEKKLAFHYKPLWQKALVVAAGPAANFILSIAVLTLLYAHPDYRERISSNIVDTVKEQSPADISGLKQNDQIVEINGEKIEQLKDIISIVRINANNEIELKYIRDSQLKTIKITPELSKVESSLDDEAKAGVIGITTKNLESKEAKNLPVPQAFVKASETTYDMSKRILQVLGQLITGEKSIKELKGMVTIADYSGKAAERGFLTVLFFIAIISINLGVINLLPIPMLDGGHLMFYLIDFITGRRLAISIQEWSTKIGAVFLIGLMIYINLNDIIHYVGKLF